MLNDRQRKNVWESIDNSRATRRALRRSTTKGDKTRRAALLQAYRALKMAMKPVRREIHRTQYEPQSDYRLSVLRMSEELRRERRRVWKMLQPSKRVEERLIDRIQEML